MDEDYSSFLTTFRTNYPMLTSQISDIESEQNATITRYLHLAEVNVDRNYFGENIIEVVVLAYVAHFVVISIYNQTGAARQWIQTTSVSASGVSTSGSTSPQVMLDPNNFSATTYGGEYLMYCQHARNLHFFVA